MLNSKLFFFAIKYFYGGGALGENGVRMKHTFFGQFNAYIPTQEEENALSSMIQSDVTSEIANNIDNFFFKIYGLTNEEVKFIEDQL